MRCALIALMVGVVACTTARAVEQDGFTIPEDFLTSPGDPEPNGDGTWFLGAGPPPGEANLNVPAESGGFVAPVPTPEPATLALLAAGGTLALWTRRRRQR